MATGHFLTNRGKLLVVQGAWDDDASTIIRMGLVKVQAAAHDTAVEVADLNTVADLVAGGSTECDFTNYVRKNLTRTNWAEDDANDWAQAVATTVTWTAAGGTTNNTIVGAFFYDASTDTNDTTRLLLSVDWFASAIPTNGGDYSYNPSSGLYRAA